MSDKEYPETVVSSVEFTTEEVTDYAVTETETVEEAILTGTVVGCTKLNVRNKPTPDSAVVTTITDNTEVEINEDESTEEFYKICTAAGVEGFCMRKFITLK